MPVVGWDPTRLSRRLARAAWARCTGPATRVSTARSQSRCCRRSLPADPQFRERFDREARAISSLNHPAHLHALRRRATRQASDFLVMEYLEGETLARPARRKGALPLDEALDHRDPDRRCARQGASRGHRPSRSEARQHHVDEVRGAQAARLRTGEGGPRPWCATQRLLSMLADDAARADGTGQPSSARSSTWRQSRSKGCEADARTDIFAFGARAVRDAHGAAGVRRQDARTTARRDSQGRAAARLDGAAARFQIARSHCQHVPRQGAGGPMADARDLVRELRWVAQAASQGDTGGPATVGSDESVGASGDGSRSKRSSRAKWAVAGVLAAALLATTVVAIQHVREAPVPQEVVQFAIPPPDGTQFGGPPSGGTGSIPQVAISPDGRTVVFVARRQDTPALWVRPIGSAEARLLPGTDGAAFPFWSPDSRYIGFFADGKLKKVQLAGGPPIVLCNTSRGFGGSWNRANVILFSPGSPTGAASGLQRVPAAGGTPVPASALDTEYRRNVASMAVLPARWAALPLHRRDRNVLPSLEAGSCESRHSRWPRSRHAD